MVILILRNILGFRLLFVYINLKLCMGSSLDRNIICHTYLICFLGPAMAGDYNIILQLVLAIVTFKLLYIYINILGDIAICALHFTIF